MLVSGIIIFLATTLCGFAAGQGDPSVVLKVTKMKISTLKKNSFFGDWSSNINSENGENKLSMKIPCVSDLPEDLMLKFSAKINGSPIPDMEFTACKSMEDEMLGKDIINHESPIMPKTCVIKKGDYAFSGYTPDKNKLPPLPDGTIEGSVAVYLPGEDPIMLVEFEASVSHDAMKMMG